ncbi:MAG TPA: hypothetical protein VGG33_03235, partial [Polyangia bacterium]
MYNDFEIGGLLIWRWFPRQRVFVDPRLPAYPAAFHTLLGRTNLSRPEWDAAMESFDVRSALLTHAGINPRVAWWEPERWALVFRKENARVFVRRLPAWKELIAAHEIPATFVYSADVGTTTVPLERPPALSSVPLCEWSLRVGDLHFDLDAGDDRRALEVYLQALAAPAGCLSPGRRQDALSWAGAALLRHRRFAEALPLLDEAIAAAGDGGDDARLARLANRALALAGLGRNEAAAAAWDALSQGSPDSELGRKAALRAASLRGQRP